MLTLTPLHKSVQKNPYLWVCFAMIVGVMGTALASPLYPLYQQAWQLNAGDITLLYVVYMASALCSLLFLGRLSDQQGFVFVLRGGLVVVTIGIVFSAIAWGYWSFMLSRLLIGLASSMIVTSASIGLNRLNRSSDLQRAAATTSLLIAFGFGLGPLLGGLIAQWAAAPLVSSYLPSIVMGVLAIYAMFLLPAAEHKPAAPSASTVNGDNRPAKPLWRPSIHIPTAAARIPFLLASLSAFTAFSMFSLFAALAPSFIHNMVPWHGPAVSGISISIILFMSSGFQLSARRWPLKFSLMLGLGAFTLSCALLVANLQYTSVTLFSAAIITLAFGHGLCLIAGMAIVNRIALPEHRAATTSSYLIIGYLGAIFPMLTTGFLANQLGLPTALVIFCLSLGLMCLLLLISTALKLKPTLITP